MTQVIFSKRSLGSSSGLLEFDTPAGFFEFCIDQDYITEFAPLNSSTLDDSKLSVIQKNAALSDECFIDITNR